MPSDLPIVTPDPPPARRAADKYGGFYYLGLAGLVVVVAMVAWFASGLWSMRGVFRNIYALHDSRRSEVDRNNAALALANDPHLTSRQAWDIVLRKDLPPLARYLVAESLGGDVVADNPRAFALAVARGRDWPGWLRLLAVRAMAYAADDGIRIPPESLAELAAVPDPMLRLWCAYIVRMQHEASEPGLPPEPVSLEAVVASNDESASLARLLLAALKDSNPQRDRHLDAATALLRRLHPESRRVWDGWAVRDGAIQREPAR